MLADGCNTYEYLRAHPQSRDPLGLYTWDDWWHDTREGAGVVLNGYLTYSSFGDAAGLIQNMADEMVSEYSANLDSDVEWALDWQADDQAHSRLSNKWVNAALLRGAYKHWNLEYWAEWSGPSLHGSGPAVAGVHFPESFRTLFEEGSKLHHVASYFKRWEKTIGVEMRKAGVEFNELCNCIGLLVHHGPHDPAYHEYIYRSLQKINRRLKTKAARGAAVRAFLSTTGKQIADGVIDLQNFREPP
jgi:hypothetical protein